MTTLDERATTWLTVCRLDDLAPERGQVRPAQPGEVSDPNPGIARTIAVRPSDVEMEDAL